MTEPFDPDEDGKANDDVEIAGDANLARKEHDGEIPSDQGDAPAAEYDA